MSTEHLLREFQNQMYRVHTRPGNVYDIGDHLHHLTVHKRLDQDPLIQFREAYRWVDQAGARLVADAGCGYGALPSSWCVKPRHFQSMAIRSAMCNEPLFGRHWHACISRNHGYCCRVMTASSGSMMRL